MRACVYACAIPEECTTSGDRHRVIARGFMGHSGQCRAAEGYYRILFVVRVDLLCFIFYESVMLVMLVTLHATLWIESLPCCSTPLRFRRARTC